MKSVTLVSILVVALLVETVQGGLLGLLGTCPNVPCKGEKKCVANGLFHLCRKPAEKGAKCSNVPTPDGYYEGFPPCAAGLTCPKEATPQCQ